jgi:hypothetical protein
MSCTVGVFQGRRHVTFLMRHVTVPWLGLQDHTNRKKPSL